jgi:hypothetical protein
VTTLPDISVFTAALADSRFAAAVAIAAMAGLVRGLLGFGSVLIYVPLMAAVYDPRVAAGTILLIDFFTTAPFAVRELPRVTWREVMPIWIAAAISVPFGTMVLLVVDPLLLRWCIAVTVVGLVLVLASGWRYHGQPRLPITLGVGLLSGFGGGAAQISGPPVLIYWLGGAASKIATVRANLIVFFALHGAVLCTAYLLQGVLTAKVLALFVLLALPFFLGVSVGAYLFRGVGDQLYRRLAYGLIAVAALISLPLFDSLVR